jgi:hypothetical protein
MPTMKLIDVQLAQEPYKRCKECPLCGLLPKDEVPLEGYNHGCLALMVALHDDEVEGKITKHKCDRYWSSFMELPDRIYKMPEHLYKKYLTKSGN